MAAVEELHATARRIERPGRRDDGATLVALGTAGQGRLLVRAGATAEGLTLLDDVMMAASAGRAHLVRANRAVLAVAHPGDLDRRQLLAAGVGAATDLQTNTYTASREVDAATVEAARGMGYDESQVPRHIELPLASPVMFAGIRLAFVQVIATTAIGVIVTNGGGLGRFVVDGFALGRGGRDAVLAGALLLAGRPDPDRRCGPRRWRPQRHQRRQGGRPRRGRRLRMAPRLRATRSIWQRSRGSTPLAVGDFWYRGSCCSRSTCW